MALPSAAATGLYGLSLIDLAPNGPSVSDVSANSTSVRGTSAKAGMWYSRNVGLTTRPVVVDHDLLVQRGAERLRDAAFDLAAALHRD